MNVRTDSCAVRGDNTPTSWRVMFFQLVDLGRDPGNLSEPVAAAQTLRPSDGDITTCRAISSDIRVARRICGLDTVTPWTSPSERRETARQVTAPVTTTMRTIVGRCKSGAVVNQWTELDTQADINPARRLSWKTGGDGTIGSYNALRSDSGLDHAIAFLASSDRNSTHALTGLNPTLIPSVLPSPLTGTNFGVTQGGSSVTFRHYGNTGFLEPPQHRCARASALPAAM